MRLLSTGTVFGAVCCCALGVASGARVQDATRQETKPQDTKAKAPAAADAQAAADEAKMMEMYEKLSKPGPEHAAIAKLAGQWTLKVTLWMSPTAPPMELPGSMKATMENGGRYLHGVVVGDGPEGPGSFHGMSVVGFDNVTKKYQSTWTDNMGTGIGFSEGERAKDGSIVWRGRFSDSMTGTVKTIREVQTFKNDNEWTSEAFDTGADGKEFRSMMITYLRATGAADRTSTAQPGKPGKPGEPGTPGRGGAAGGGGPASGPKPGSGTGAGGEGSGGSPSRK